MIQIDTSAIRPEGLKSPLALISFEGWNDAADAASAVIDHLMRVWDAKVIGEVNPDDYYDFQVNRPHIGNDEFGMRKITWPTTRIALASPPGLARDVLLIRGIEPSMRWRQFCAELIDALESLDTTLLVTLGALLADAPHSRSLPVTGSSTEPELMDRLALDISAYEGPTGIVGVLQDYCSNQDFPAVSFWTAVPHYVSSTPSPKASLALLHRIEELIETPIDLGDLPADARMWEQHVNELAAEDPDIAEYVRSLEETRDTTDLPEASGDAIAREFERFLYGSEDDTK